MADTQRTQQVAVLGLGRFGSAVARELTRLGHEVLGVDRSEQAVQETAADVTHAAQADVTHERTLQELGLGDFDAAVVAISSNLEASILATVLCRRVGVRRIIARAGSALHAVILEQVGATRVVSPEHETGVRLARSFAAPAVQDYLDVAPGYGIARVAVAAGLAGKRLAEVEFPLDAPDSPAARLTTIALVRGGTVLLNPEPAEVAQVGDAVIVAGRDEDLARLPGVPAPPSAPRPPRPSSA
jgi:trk system potassium uptake protein TrkA